MWNLRPPPRSFLIATECPEKFSVFILCVTVAIDEIYKAID